MQFAKDSFYAALRERLQDVNPGRTTVVDGVRQSSSTQTKRAILRHWMRHSGWPGGSARP